jgi:alkanesulfonate monooxygenase SsuD/methylene tetrahydromethanopterin reductase-like flavin-dependent oxidoreductase (luciferase family)
MGRRRLSLTSVRFGFASITCQRHPNDARDESEIYREGLALAGEAERLGFDSVWVSEHHFIDDSYLASVLPFSGAIAARTETIGIGTDILLAPLYDPLRLAEDVATVDLISSGRFILGHGQGWRPEEFEALGVPLKGRHRRLEDTIGVLRQAWTDGLVTGGQMLPYTGVSVTPKPSRLGGPPVWIGGGSEAARAKGWPPGRRFPRQLGPARGIRATGRLGTRRDRGGRATV